MNATFLVWPREALVPRGFQQTRPAAQRHSRAARDYLNPTLCRSLIVLNPREE
jgi:hypothetical protein